MGAVANRDVGSFLLLLATLIVSRSFYCMRGITYRKTVIPYNLERAGKSLFYLGLLGTLDGLLRRLGHALSGVGVPVFPSSERFAGLLRLAFLHVPFVVWALTGPLSPNGCTRDDRSFSISATRSGLWHWISSTLFKKQTRIVLSEEWRDLSPETRLRWMERDNFVIGMHPHGLLPIGAILNGLTWAGGGLKGMTASGAELPENPEAGPGLHQKWFRKMRLRAAVASGACALVPGFHEMFKKLGAFECTKPFMKAVLRDGKSVAVFPGGAAESAYAAPNKYVCFVKQRKGFVRVALEERLDILPMYTFGDEALVPQSLDPPAFMVWLQRICKEATGLLVPPTFGGLPQLPPLTLVTGVPVSLEDLWPAEVDGEVSDAAVDEGHRRYMKAMQDLFDKNKALVPGGHQNAVMEFL